MSQRSDPMAHLAEKVSSLSDKQRALLALRFQKAGMETRDIPRRRQDGPPPAVSFAQQRLWFLNEYAPGSPVYNVPSALRLQGRLEVAALARSLAEIVRRHEVLRTTLRTVDEVPVQIIAPSLSIPLNVVDLSALPPAMREEEVGERVSAEARRSFDLERGPLFRAGLVRLGREDHVLMLTQHHVVSDGWSAGILARELSVLYAAFVAGESSPLPELPIQYADFAVWQREWLSGKVLAEQLSFWQERLRGLAVLELPSDRPRPAVQSFRGLELARLMPGRLAADLKLLSRRHGVTLFMTVLAAYTVVLQRLSGQSDIAVGSAIAGRNRAEIEPLIGFFVNMLVLRTDLSGDPPFPELLRQVRETTLGAYAHQDLPFEKLVNALRPARDASRPPLFQVVLTLQNAPAEPPAFPGLTVHYADYETGTSRFDLTINLVEQEEGFLAAVEYNTDLFDTTTVERLLSQYETVLEGVVAEPDRRLSALPVLPAWARAQAVVEWNDSRRRRREQTLPAAFTAQAGSTPEAVAAVFEEEALSYGELLDRSCRLGRHLRRLGAGPEVLVGLAVERGLAMVVGMMGILQSGAAYLPLDPSYPPARLAHMLGDARSPVVVTQEHLLALLPEHGGRTVRIDEDWSRIARRESSPPAPGVVPESLAYTLYTSGSTGAPKGVQISQRAVTQFAATAAEGFGIGPGERMLQFASICFDVSVFDLFPTLLYGATLCLGRRETLLAPETLTELMARRGVTVADVPPALLGLMEPSALPALRVLFVGLEKFSGELVERWWSPGRRRFVNGYGPTEATVAVIWKDCRPPYEDSPPIGLPMANHEMYVLDRQMNVVPVGAAGELWVGGVGLARGYHGQPGLTAGKFLPDPFSGRPGSRLYRTGDLVRYLPSGDAEFLGRVDDQVKIRGLRIELGEVQRELGAHPAVQQAVVMVREDEPGARRLVAYLVAAGEARPGVSELRGFLGQRLPAYMIPSAFVLLEELPTSLSGKVDRRRLPVPEPERPELAEGFVAPRTATEKALVEEAFAPVLGLERVGVEDNFFELGGNSLQATQLISRVRRLFDLDLPLRRIFQAPTVAGLAQAVEEIQRERGGEEQALEMLDQIEHLSPEEVKRLLASESEESETMGSTTGASG